MNWIQNLVVKLLHITPAYEQDITIRQAYTFQQNILKNRIWYQGEPAELEQFFKKTSKWENDLTKFWAAIPNSRIRKIHSGIVSMVVGRYSDIVTSNYEGISFGEDENIHPLLDTWNEIAEDNDFTAILAEAVTQALAVGDGAFKISTDQITSYPIIEFYEAENVSFDYRYGRLQSIRFYTDYPQKNGHGFRLEETYGKGEIQYRLYDDKGREHPLNRIEETKDLSPKDHYDGDYIMGVPFKIFNSSKWKGRGKALFDTKSDVLDALDEVISQWLDAVRLGRIKRYIPDNLIPKDPETGKPMAANPFDNDFMAIEGDMNEGAASKIDVSQPEIAYEAYVTSYISFMDMVLQGIISPSTLGIDLKKTDNAESQREKEKITLYVRGKIIDALNKMLPQLVSIAMKVYNMTKGTFPEDREITAKFSEYVSPDFDSTVDTISKARSAAVMSIEKAIDELYGDSMSEEEKAEEIERLKAEIGIETIEEPDINMNGLEEVEDESQGGEKDISDGAQKVPRSAQGGK